MTTIHFIVCLLHGYFAQPAPIDFNPFRDFRPVQHAEKLVNPLAHPTQAHPIAYECTITDTECIAKHEVTIAVVGTPTDGMTTVEAEREQHARWCSGGCARWLAADAPGCLPYPCRCRQHKVDAQAPMGRSLTTVKQ